MFLLEVEPEWPGIGAHDHDDQVDTFFVLEGEAGFRRRGIDEVVTRGAGARSTPPRRAPGTASCTAGGGSCLLNMHGPDAGFAESIRRM